MNIQLIEGEFFANDALDLITKMIHTKIKYHEEKILKENNEEDIKMRETKIKRLQKDLYDARRKIEKTSGKIILDSQLTFNN